MWTVEPTADAKHWEQKHFSEECELSLDLTECLGDVNMASDLLDLQEDDALHFCSSEASAIVRVDWNCSGRRLACSRNKRAVEGSSQNSW